MRLGWGTTLGDLTVLYSWGVGSSTYINTTCWDGTKKRSANLDVATSGKFPPYISKYTNIKPYNMFLIWYEPPDLEIPPQGWVPGRWCPIFSV